MNQIRYSDPCPPITSAIAEYTKTIWDVVIYSIIAACEKHDLSLLVRRHTLLISCICDKCSPLVRCDKQCYVYNDHSITFIVHSMKAMS